MKKIILVLMILGLGSGAVYAEDIMQYKNKSHKCEKKYGGFSICMAIDYLLEYHELVTTGRQWGYTLSPKELNEAKEKKTEYICSFLYNQFTREDDAWRLDGWTINGKVVLPSKACD